MYQTLVLAGIVAINVYNGINNTGKLDKNQLLLLFLGAIICGPIVEEILFRYALRDFLVGFTYRYEINALLFGLLHSTNYFTVPNKSLVLWQMCATSYLGYYVVQFDSLYYACLVHMLYNLLCLGSSQAYLHYYDVKVDNPFCNQNEKFIKLNSVDDYLNQKSKMDYRTVKFRPDIKESFDLYDSKKRPNKNNFNINLDEILTKSSKKIY